MNVTGVSAVVMTVIVRLVRRKLSFMPGRARTMVRNAISVVVVGQIEDLHVTGFPCGLLPDHREEVKEDGAEEDSSRERKSRVVPSVLEPQEQRGEAAAEANYEDGNCVEHVSSGPASKDDGLDR